MSKKSGSSSYTESGGSRSQNASYAVERNGASHSAGSRGSNSSKSKGKDSKSSGGHVANGGHVADGGTHGGESTAG